MSQTYQCQLKESVQQPVRFRDTVHHRLILTPILRENEMVNILQQALQEASVLQQGQRWLLDGTDAVSTVDLNDMRVTTSLHEERLLSTEALATGGGGNKAQAQRSAEEQQPRARERTQVDRQRQQHALQLDATATVGIADGQPSVRLHRILQEVYAESLKRKARQLGDVMEITEGTTPSSEHGLVIKVKT